MEEINKKINKINNFKRIQTILSILFFVTMVMAVIFSMHNENLAWAIAGISIALVVAEVIISFIPSMQIFELKEDYEKILVKEKFLSTYMMNVIFLQGPEEENGVNIIIIFHGKVTTSYLSFEELDMLFEVSKV